jgi:ribosomal protein S18 acetylase RimI-like enzyme
MVVTENARGKGIGTALINRVLDYAEAQGVRRVTLLTDSENYTAQALYKQSGFTRSDMVIFRQLLGKGTKR